MDARSLIETLKGRGLSLYLEGERIKVEAPQEPNPETKALISELGQHREEVKIILAAPSCWNCGAMMTQTKDIYGAEVFICIPCTRSSKNPPFPDAIRAWEIERVQDDATGALRAVKICSAVLEMDMWLLVDPSFLPPDGDPVFFEGELAFLAKKSAEEMKEIIKVKCAFPRCRVVQ